MTRLLEIARERGIEEVEDVFYCRFAPSPLRTTTRTLIQLMTLIRRVCACAERIICTRTSSFSPIRRSRMSANSWINSSTVQAMCLEKQMLITGTSMLPISQPVSTLFAPLFPFSFLIDLPIRRCCLDSDRRPDAGNSDDGA